MLLITPHSRCVAYAPWSARGKSKEVSQADNPAPIKRIAPGLAALSRWGFVNLERYRRSAQT